MQDPLRIPYPLFLMLVLLLAGTLPGRAQEQHHHQEQEMPEKSPAALNLDLKPHYGFIIPHTSTIREVANTRPWALEADLSLHFTNRRAWSYLQSYPRLGASFSYINFSFPEVLGWAGSLVLYAEPFLSAHRNFSFSFRLGGGLAYLNKPYHAQDNPRNLYYSTTFSFPLVANLMLNYRLSERLMLRAGSTFTHISNGSIRQPNAGINFLTATAGLGWALRPVPFPTHQPEQEGAQGREREYLLVILGGFKERADDREEQLPVLGLSLYASQRIGRLSALSLGAEWVADYTIRHHLHQQGSTDTPFSRAGLLLGHELRIGRVRLSQQLGVYVYAPFPARDPVYQRWGMEYHSRKRLFGGINLKAHRQVAEFLDMRLGVKF